MRAIPVSAATITASDGCCAAAPTGGESAVAPVASARPTSPGFNGLETVVEADGEADRLADGDGFGGVQAEPAPVDAEPQVRDPPAQPGDPPARDPARPAPDQPALARVAEHHEVEALEPELGERALLLDLLRTAGRCRLSSPGVVDPAQRHVAAVFGLCHEHPVAGGDLAAGERGIDDGGVAPDPAEGVAGEWVGPPRESRRCTGRGSPPTHPPRTRRRFTR